MQHAEYGRADQNRIPTRELPLDLKQLAGVGNGTWPISNNLSENAIQPFVVAERVGCSPTQSLVLPPVRIFSVVETCKANRTNPYQYLVWLFTKLPLATTGDGYGALHPWNMTSDR